MRNASIKLIVHARPGAKHAGVKKIDDVSFIISVKEKARGGEANEAIRKAIANYFNVASSRIRLHLGRRAKRKIFEITVKKP